MALSTATISYNLDDLLGADLVPESATMGIRTNVPGETIVDTVGNAIRLGPTGGKLATGAGSVAVWIPGTGSNPATWQTYIDVTYRAFVTQPNGGYAKMRKTRTFGPFTITADADLADLVAEQEVPATYLSQVTAELQEYVDDAEAARDAAVDISGISTSDAVVEALVKNTGGAGPLTSGALTDLSADLRTAAKLGQTWWDEAFAAPVADDTPTVAVATSGAISGGTAVTPTADFYGDPSFFFDGCADVTGSGGTVSPVQPSAASATASYTVVPEFVTSQGCDKVDVKLTTNAAGTSIGVRVIVNDRWLTLPLQWFTTTASTVHYIRLVFPTAKSRRIKVEVVNLGNFGGVVVPSGETVLRSRRAPKKRMVILGDSYTIGANANTTSDPATNGCSRFETAAHLLAKLLGCDSVINLGVGGTGWYNDGGGGKSIFGQRVADVLAASPHIVLAAGSRNDSTGTSAQVYAAAVAALNQFADVPVVLVNGLGDAGAGSGTAAATINESVKQAARTVARRFLDTIGVVGSGDKNSADSVHPSVLGAQKLAKAMYAGIDRAVLDETVAAANGGLASTDLTLTASPALAAASGAAVTLTATQSVQRTGKVAFYANGVLLGTSTLAAGVATYATSALADGTYTLTARYLPTNPMLVRQVSSNALAYTISANLGFTDNFNRADGAPGSTTNGKAYTSGGGNGSWLIASNKLGNPSNTTGSAYLVADAGTPNGTLTFTIGGSGGVGLGVLIPARYVTSNNLLRLQRSGNEIQLAKVIGGAATQLAISTGSSIWVTGDVITVVFNNNGTLTVKKNGTNVPGLVNVTCADSDTAAQGIDTATKFGVGVSTTSGAAATFDDLSFVAA